MYQYVIFAGLLAPLSRGDRFMHGGAGLIAGLIVGGIFLAWNYARGNF